MRPSSVSPTERRPASAVPTITGLRFMPGNHPATLVNVSTTGLLAEATTGIPVDTAVEVIFEGGFSPTSANGRVARCQVAEMGSDALLRYQIAVEFDTPISFGDAVRPQADPASQKPRNRW